MYYLPTNLKRELSFHVSFSQRLHLNATKIPLPRFSSTTQNICTQKQKWMRVVDYPQVSDPSPNFSTDLEVSIPLYNPSISMHCFRARHAILPAGCILANLQTQSGRHLRINNCTMGPCIDNAIHQFPIYPNVTHVLRYIPSQKLTLIIQINGPIWFGVTCGSRCHAHQIQLTYQVRK